MKRYFIILSMLLAFCMSTGADVLKFHSVKGDPMNTRIYTLDNGLTVYISVNKEKPRIQTYIAVRTGSRNDPPQTTGLAHYLEHLMFKGTTHFGTSDIVKETPLLDSIEREYEVYRNTKTPEARKQIYHKIDSLSQVAAQYNIPNEYDKLMAAIGSEGSNAYTSTDVTCYKENIPANEMDNWAKIQADRFRNMVIRGFHTELEAVYEEYNMSLTQDSRKKFNAINAKLFPGHPYGTQTTLGTQEHLKNPSIVNIKNYFKNYYVPNNVAICMSGDLDPDEAMAIITKYFGDWKRNDNISFPQYAPVRNLTAPTDTTVVGPEAENVCIAWKFNGAASFQCDTLKVMTKMLYNGSAGLMDLNLDQEMKWLGGGAFAYNNAEYSALIAEGYPKEGQTLDDVRKLILTETGKLKKGEFSDDLLQSVINNMKKDYYSELESNEKRASFFVSAFVNGEKWEDHVNKLNRISHLTKQDIINFANKYLNDNYAVVYKKKGVDTTQKKIDKPQITPIAANRELQSKFVADIISTKTKEIQPHFVDYNTDLTKMKTKSGLPVLYVKNNDNGLFNLSFYYEFGDETDKWLSYAFEYADFLGTDKLTKSQLKQEFYKLACDYSMNVSSNTITVNLSGLNENMPAALKLLENYMSNVKVDKDSYDTFVQLVEKQRNDSKLSQKSNFQALIDYAMYGPFNPTRNIPSNKELEGKNPQELVDIIKDLRNYKHTVLYYGPTEGRLFTAILDKNHKTGKNLRNVPAGTAYTLRQTPANEVIIAPYDAKNIYMRQYHNDGRKWDVNKKPVTELFNEYFGGGMNTVVFQELRETRGLAYNAWAIYRTPGKLRDTEYAMTHIITQNDKMMDCINTFNTIINDIPQSEKAFNLCKQALMKRLAAARTTKSSIIYSYLAAKKLGIDFDIKKKLYDEIPNLSLQDMVNFEKSAMAHKPYCYIILGKEADLDIKSLEKIAPVKRLTTEDIFGY